MAGQTFDRNFFGIFNFRTGKNLAGKISIQKFLQFSTFAAKIFRQKIFHGQKEYAVSDPYPRLCLKIYDGSHQVLRIVSAVFQLSRRIFLEFSTFNRKFFWFFRFRAEKKRPKKFRGK